MVKRSFWCHFSLCLAMVVILSACQPNPLPLATQAPSDVPTGTPELSSTVTPAPLPTSSPTNAPSPNPTAAPTSTPLPTIAPTATSTELPSPTVTATVVPISQYNRPGTYPLYICAVYTKHCIMDAQVLYDGRIVFFVQWTYIEGFSRYRRRLTLESYIPAKLYDDLGNVYETLDVGGEITGVYYPQEGTYIYTGWYEFPAPKKKATSFTLVTEMLSGYGKMERRWVWEEIILINPVIINATLNLVQYPLVVDYKVANWEPGQTAEGEVMLSHKTIPGCQVTEWKTSEPQGELKNTVTLGTLTYEIYGWIESENNLGYREYLLTGGIVGFDPPIKPLFRVAIPLDQSEPCIYAASDLLKGLRPAD